MPLDMEVGLGPGDFVFHRDPARPRKKAQPHPNFGPCLLWPNGWIDEDVTWYGGKPLPRRRCVRLGRSSPLKGAQPPVFGIYCGQTAGWMKTPLGTEVELGPGHIALDGDSTAPRKGHSSPPPLFGPCLLWPRSPISATPELLFINGAVKSATLLAHSVFASVSSSSSPSEIKNSALVDKLRNATTTSFRIRTDSDSH